MRRYGRKLSLVGATLAVFLIGSVVFAAWLVTGTGNGAAQATTADDLVVTAGSTTGDLFPGADGDVKLSIENPNPFDVDVKTIVGDGAITSAAPGCTTTGVSFADQNAVTGMTIAAGATEAVTLDDAASMDNTSDNACQGATFTVPVSITAESATS
ncbi:MAG: hypothetical protein M3343_02660 [Actinomycetota bacterium]|nr:hypothetical protein [Actinomycetota bacterium]